METLAGASMAWVGTAVPSGSVVSGVLVLEATTAGALAPAMLAVNAADSSASGTNAVARRRRPCRRAV